MKKRRQDRRCIGYVHQFSSCNQCTEALGWEKVRGTLQARIEAECALAPKWFALWATSAHWHLLLNHSDATAEHCTASTPIKPLLSIIWWMLHLAIGGVKWWPSPPFSRRNTFPSTCCAEAEMFAAFAPSSPSSTNTYTKERKGKKWRKTSTLWAAHSLFHTQREIHWRSHFALIKVAY